MRNIFVQSIQNSDKGTLMKHWESKRWFMALIKPVMVFLGLLSIGLHGGSAFAANPTVFTPFIQPIGVAAAPQKLIVTEYCSLQIDQIDSSGNVTPFAMLPSGGGCVERYVAISPGLGGFTANDIFVTQGPDIWKISPDGLTVTLFATIPSLPGSHNGITFDHVGTSFGYDMIIAGFNGEVWRVNAAGVATFVANVGVGLEGPEIAPAGFGPLAGHIFAAAENASLVYAISSAGVVTVVAAWPSAESVHLIPNNPCSFGSSGGSFFSAIYPVNITMFPPSDFSGLGGKLLVTSEIGGGIGLLTFDGTNYVMSPFHANLGQHEGSAFVDCAVPPEKTGRMTGGGSVFTANGMRVTHGFGLNCDANQSPSHLEINWGKGNKFHMENLDSAMCTDTVFDERQPEAGFDTHQGTGTGSYNGQPGWKVEFKLIDAGEPGINDYASILIKNAAGDVTVLDVAGNLRNGNHQAHPH